MTHYNDKIKNAWLTHFMAMEPSVALEQIDVLVAKHIEADNTRVAGFFLSIQERIACAVGEFKAGYKEDL